MFVSNNDIAMQNEMTPTQSLKLIEEMVQQAKQSFQKSNFYFLLWGALLAFAGVVDHVLKQSDVSMHWVVWPAMAAIGAVVSSVHGAKEGKEQGVMTMMDRVQMWLWTGFSITLALVIFSAVFLHRDPNPFVLLLTGLPTFVTGALIRFRPLMIGGVLFWLIGLVSILTLQEYSSLVFAFAITVGYIVPGFLLKRREDGV